MTRGRRAGLILIAWVALSAQLTPPWQNWRYFAQVEGAGPDAARLVSIRLPAGVSARARSGWEDLRVVDAQGAEVPYVLHARLGGRSVEQRQTRLLDPSVVPGQYTEAIIDVGSDARVHNAATLRIAAPGDVLTWCEIAVGDDRHAWRVVRERAPIYRLLSEGIGERTLVSYPDSGARYLRVRILDETGNARLIGADVAYEVVSKAERVPIDVPLSAETSGPSQTAWVSSANVAAPVSEVRFVTSAASFHRAISIDMRNRDERWTRITSGEIFRTSESGGARAVLAVEFPEATSERWRVIVHDRNDAPIPDLRATLYTVPRRVVFSQQPGARYRLLFGNPRAKAPQYGLSRLMDAKAIDAAVDVSLGPEETNRAWVDPAPWTERHEGVLWAALAAAALVLGYIALRTLRG